MQMPGSEGRAWGFRATIPEGLVGLPGGCCLIAGPERRGEAGRSKIRAGILRLGAALAGKADAVLKSWQALFRCSIREGQRCEPYVSSPRGELPRMSGGPQATKKPSMRRASSFPMGGQASGTVLGRAYGHVWPWAGMPYRLKKWLEREALWEGASRLMREKPLPSMFVCGRS